MIIRGPPRNGPPLEKSIGLSNITAPKLGRRGRDVTEVKDSVSSVQMQCVTHHCFHERNSSKVVGMSSWFLIDKPSQCVLYTALIVLNN